MTKLVIILSIFALGACSQRKGPMGPQGPVRSNGEVQSPQMTGSTSGGGGYGSEPGLYVMSRVKAELVNELSLLNNEILSKVSPKDIKQDLIDIVKSLKPDDRNQEGLLKPVVRDGEELYFDYVDRNGKLIILATKLFFQSHADFEFSELSESEIVPKIRFFKVRALHEALHHLGIGTSKTTDKRARQAAEAIVYAIETNNLICRASTKQMPQEYFRFWQRYRVFDPLFKNHCLSQIKSEAQAFYVGSGIQHTNGTRMDLQINDEIIEQEMVWVINRPTGMGIYDPNLDIAKNNTPEDQLSESRLTAIQEGRYKFLSNHDSDKRRGAEEHPYYSFRNPLSYFASYDFSFASNPSYLSPSKYLDWQGAKLEVSGSISYISKDEASAFIVKSSDPVTYSENFICDTQVYYESNYGDLPVEPGERLHRHDLEVREEIILADGNVENAKLKFYQAISKEQDFHLGAWASPGTENVKNGEFDLNCEEYKTTLDPKLFIADQK